MAVLFSKQQVRFSSNFASPFSVMKDNSSVLLLLKQYILCSKGSHSSENFWDFQVLRSNFVKFLMPILKREVNSSLNFASFFSVITYNSSVNFNSCVFYFGQKDPIKAPILTLSSALVKICEVPHAIFQITRHFFFKMCITL